MRLRTAAFTVALCLGSTSARNADALSGIFVGKSDAKLPSDASVVVLLRDGTRTVLSMQDTYLGPREDFAMVVPVPTLVHRDSVKVLSRSLFDRIDRVAAPRLVERWEQDPCSTTAQGALEGGAAPVLLLDADGGEDAGLGDNAEMSAGEYNIVVLNAEQSAGIEGWLSQEGYRVPVGAGVLLRKYAASSRFLIVKVDTSKLKFDGGRAILSPLRLDYESAELCLPVGLGVHNSPGTQDVVVNILARAQRFEVSDHDANVTMPTNLDLDVRGKDQFGEFYAALFDRAQERNPKAVITEYVRAADSCDSCSGSSLSSQDLLTLGGDVLPAPGSTSLVVAKLTKVSTRFVANGQEVLTGALPKFQACFVPLLGASSSPGGTATVRASFGTDEGSLEYVEVALKGNLSPSATGCIERVLRGLGKQFVARTPRGDGTFSSADSATMHVEFTLDLSLRAPSPGEKPWSPSAPISTADFILTRMHARLSKDTPGDLCFRQATPIQGGVEDPSAAAQDNTARAGSTNNFQARYSVRHPWPGRVSCNNPRRGVWGGPNGSAAPKATPALHTALAPRGNVNLLSLLRQPVPSLGIAPKPAPPSSKSCGACAARTSSSQTSSCWIAAAIWLLAAGRRRRR